MRSCEAIWVSAEGANRNLVTIDGKEDKTPGSPAVVAFSLLLDENVFSHHELKEFIKGVKENLLVEKK